MRPIDAEELIRSTINNPLHVPYITKTDIEAAPTLEIEPQWIPCSEKLPDDDRTKVVTLANGNAEAGYYSNGDWWCIGDSICLENPKVIAWMPLPEPYEVDE
jgi:hypothetical protein